MTYCKNYCEEKGISTSKLSEPQKTLYYIAENMKMKKSISEEGYRHFQMAIKALEQTEWIPVSERLPKSAGYYVVTRQIGSNSITSACYFDGINTWYNDNRINHERNYLTNIVAWMSSPESIWKTWLDG